MKVAIAINERGEISEHFGRSAQFCVFKLQSGEVVGQETRDNPRLGEGHGREKGCGHGHHGHGHGHGRRGRGLGLDRPCDSGNRGHAWIQETLGDCDVVIACGIGAGALAALQVAGVRPVVLDRKLVEKINAPQDALRHLHQQ